MAWPAVPNSSDWLRMIKNAEHLGLSLDEIAGLIASDPESGGVSAIAARKLAETDAGIARPTLVREALALTAWTP
jgi:DNA-binding transcriptional MerR regulator